MATPAAPARPYAGTAAQMLQLKLYLQKRLKMENKKACHAHYSMKELAEESASVKVRLMLTWKLMMAMACCAEAVSG